MISGVSAGLGHYFGIDAWVEYLYSIGGERGVLAIILWIVVPAAVTEN
jgi:phage shock protein PspC (stress-responsive transcriptional regulator)